MIAAIAGLVYLVLPGLRAPSPYAAALMGIAGIAWGVYSLRGQRIGDPITATTGTFIGAVPMALIVGLFFLKDLSANTTGVMLAVLSVPAIAALGGAVMLSEPLTVRLLVASVTILGGIGIVLSQRHS